METKDKLYIIGIVIGITGSIFGGFLSDMQIFKIYPNFSVSVLSSLNNDTHDEILLIKNIERIQAKNTAIFVISNGPLTVNDKICLEGTHMDNYSENILRIDFEKMSSNIQCNIFFSSAKNSEIKNVVITSDDSPGHTYSPVKKEEYKSGNTTITNTAFDELDKEESGLINFLWPLALTELISLIILFTYRQIRMQKWRKEYEIVENEIKNSLDRAKEEYDVISKSTIMLEDTPPYLKNRTMSLRDRIITEKRNLDEIRSKMFTYRGLHKLVTDFFERWIELENQLINLIHIHQIDALMPSSYNMVKQLEEKHIIGQDILEKLSVLRKFRNNLSHGLIKSTKTELQEKINQLDELLKSLNMTNNEIS